MNMQTTMTIGALAKAAGVGVETVRFYERKGIITQPPKTAGFRYYSEEDTKRIRLVKKLQEIGFTLDEIKAFLEFDTCCSQSRQVIRQQSQDKIVEITQKIADLQSALKALEKFVGSCGAESEPSLECELLDCFENQWECCAPKQ